MHTTPELLKDMLLAEYGEDLFLRIEDGYRAKRVTSARVNRIKSTPDDVIAALAVDGIEAVTADFCGPKAPEITSELIIRSVKTQRQLLSCALDRSVPATSLSIQPAPFCARKTRKQCEPFLTAPGSFRLRLPPAHPSCPHR